jgi:putative NADPH-quinone reductase
LTKHPAPVLVVYAHPDPDSFCAHVFDRVVATLTARGHSLDVIDLYAAAFDPAFNVEDLSAHDNHTQPTGVVAEHVARLRRARVVVFVYPTWYGGPPAMLKGWIDRVFTPGVPLRNIRRLVVVTTHGSSKVVNAIGGEPGKRMIFRTLRVLCHPLARSRWIALYDTDRATDGDRAAFLTEVDRRLSAI